MADLSRGIVVRDRRGVRDPQAATITTGWAARGLPMVPEWDAAQAIRWAYLANSIVHRCVRVTADALGRVPFRVGADPNKPSDYDPTHPLARLLGPTPGSPNPVTSPRRLWAWTIAQYLVTGRWCWETELADGTARPVALWPLPASQLRAIPSAKGNRYFDRFEFGPTHDPKRLTPDQVVYGWRPSQHDWREPESILQAARLDVSVAVMQDRYDYAFLRNGSRPDFLIVTPEFEEDDEASAFRSQWNAEHRGPDNAGKPAFVEATPDENGKLSDAVVVKQLGLSQKDSESIERYRQKIAAICVAFGTPMSKLGDASGRTFSNAGQEDRNWWEDTLLPLGEELADEVNTQLAPRLGGAVGWFDWSTVRALQPAPKFQEVGIPELVAGKVARLNEGRAMLDLPPVEGGDELDVQGAAPDMQAAATAFQTLVGAGVDPASAAETVGLPGLVMAPPKPDPVPVPVLVPAQTDGSMRSAEDRSDAPSPAPDQPDPLAMAAARREERWRALNRRAEQQEKIWTKAMRRLFEQQQRAVLTLLTGKRGRQLLSKARASDPADDPAPQVDPAQVFDQAYWTAETAARTAELIATLTATAGADMEEQFEAFTFDLEAPYAQEMIQARANQLAGQVTDTTYSAIRDALAAGVAAGEDIDTIADRVRHVFTVASDARAVTIARTEVISGYNAAAHLLAAQLPADVAAGKEWIATRDSRVREAHADADGQTVPLTGLFTVMGEQVLYPGDGSASNVVNCRCTVGFLTLDEMAERHRQVDVRTARLALDLVAAGVLAPEDLRARLRAVA